MLENLVAGGGERAERALAIAAEEGWLPERYKASLRPEQRAPETDPNYRLNFAGLADPSDGATIASANRELSDGLAAMKFEAHVGSSLGRMMVQDAQAFNALPQDRREFHLAEQRAHLRALYPNVTEAVKLADAVVARMDPAMAAGMSAAGYFRSAAVISQLVLQAKRLGITA
jgi:hypothetical protein